MKPNFSYLSNSYVQMRTWRWKNLLLLRCLLRIPLLTLLLLGLLLFLIRLLLLLLLSSRFNVCRRDGLLGWGLWCRGFLFLLLWSSWRSRCSSFLFLLDFSIVARRHGDFTCYYIFEHWQALDMVCPSIHVDYFVFLVNVQRQKRS